VGRDGRKALKKWKKTGGHQAAVRRRNKTSKIEKAGSHGGEKALKKKGGGTRNQGTEKVILSVHWVGGRGPSPEKLQSRKNLEKGGGGGTGREKRKKRLKGKTQEGPLYDEKEANQRESTRMLKNRTIEKQRKESKSNSPHWL